MHLSPSTLINFDASFLFLEWTKLVISNSPQKLAMAGSSVGITDFPKSKWSGLIQMFSVASFKFGLKL